jgi:hypothetical protein
VASIVALFLRFPQYETMSGILHDLIGRAISWQVQHPFTPIPGILKDVRANGGMGSHVDKMELRITVPLLGHLSHTGPWTLPVWGSIAAVLLFLPLALCARDAIGDKTTAALFVIGLILPTPRPFALSQAFTHR